MKAQRRRQRNNEGQSQRPPQKVTLYFNKYDEFVDEIIAQSDPNSYYHKYHAVEVDFGGYEKEGRDILTKDIFWGQKKTENL